jgi:hypothetical protein
MKLQLRLLALLLTSFMVLAYAAPNKSLNELRPVAEVTDDGAPTKALAIGEEAVGDLLLQAMSLIGVAYRWGGSNPTAGLDCSGFIQYVFKKSLKVSLPRTAAEMARSGRAVDKSELAAGDLVFFNTLGGRYSHVGIYMGNGKFIHSPRTGKSVEVSNMGQSYWVAHYTGARRVTRNASSLPEATVAAETTSETAAAPAKREAARVVVKCRRGHRCVAASKQEARERAVHGKGKARAPVKAKAHAAKGKKKHAG